MKLDKKTSFILFNKHIFQLTEDELRAIAFLYTIEILDYHKSLYHVSFIMKHDGSSVKVNCMWNYFLSMYVKRKVVNRITAKRMYENRSSFADAVSLFANFYTTELLMRPNWNDCGSYTSKQRVDLLNEANKYIGVTLK